VDELKAETEDNINDSSTASGLLVLVLNSIVVLLGLIVDSKTTINIQAFCERKAFHNSGYYSSYGFEGNARVDGIPSSHRI
jgi:hypothetical protein